MDDPFRPFHHRVSLSSNWGGPTGRIHPLLAAELNFPALSPSSPGADLVVFSAGASGAPMASLEGVNGSSNCRGTSANRISITGLSGSVSCGRVDSARSFSSSAASLAKGVKSKIFGASGLDYTDIPNAQIIKVTVNRFLASKQTIPHYYLTVDTRVNNLMNLRGELNPLQEASGGKKISINDIVIKAAALALRKIPQCDSSWMNDITYQCKNVNINLAVQTEHGLFFPVVRGADKKGLGTIGEEVKQLAQRARDNSLKPKNYELRDWRIAWD